MGAMLAQKAADSHKENAIYYLSKRMLAHELKYSKMEQLCLSLVWVCHKLRHYLSSFTTYVIADKSPLKFLIEKPTLDSKMARWSAILAAFDLKYAAKKAIKGSIIANQLASAPTEGEAFEPEPEFPDENILEIHNPPWKLFFDGASNHRGYGAGIVLVTPEGDHLPMAVKLAFEVTNNEAEYEACLAGLEAAQNLKISHLEVYGDSNLIVSQALGKWKIREERLVPYHQRLTDLAQSFQDLSFHYLPRTRNQFADALATLASMVDMQNGEVVQPVVIKIKEQPSHNDSCMNMQLADGKPWYWDIYNYLQNGEYPEGASKSDRRTLRHLSSRFITNGEVLYKRTWDNIHLRCVTEEEAQQIMEWVHGGESGPHMNGMALARKIANLGYYWLTMNQDCAKFVQKCHKCQVFAKLQHLPPVALNPIQMPWPFATWGLDVIGKITPKSSSGHEYILVAIDYFTKWVEAAAYQVLTAKKVAQFIQTCILYRFGTPFEVITDNGSHFQGEVSQLLQKEGIQRHRSSPYRPQTNGAVEAANKTLKSILQKMVDKHRNWHEKLAPALWGYRTSTRTPTGATPYALVHGMEAVLPIELQIQSARVMRESQISEADWVKSYHEQLNAIDEKRLDALSKIQGYQQKLARHFNKRVKDRGLEEGVLVLKEIRAPVHDPRGKFRPNWAGPYMLKKILSGGAAILTDLDGLEFSNPCNLDQLKRYFI